MNATQPRLKKQARSVCLVERSGEWFLLAVCDGRHTEPTYYLARRIASDWGTAFELEKQDAQGTAETYRVCLAGRDSTCDCKGHCYRGHCKHVLALQALAAHGRLPGYRSPSLVELDRPFRPGRDDEPTHRPTHCGCRCAEEHQALCLDPWEQAAH